MSVIGYSEADFKTLISEKRLYVDRTAFIRTMESQSNKNLIFVRPRRFGKLIILVGREWHLVEEMPLNK